MQTKDVQREIDLLLLCGARPHLLEKTLESFSKKVFPNFVVRNVFANIDEFMGGESQVASVESLIKSYYADATIYKPKSPSFTGAVVRLWSSVKSNYCFHLEDDWVANRTIDATAVMPHFQDNTAQVSIATAEKNWPREQNFHCKWTRRRIFGIKFGRRYLLQQPVFTTSPAFMKRDFVHGCSALMDLNLDPEKQFYDGNNLKLQDYVRAFRNRVIGNGPDYLISDIGRDYRSSIGLTKKIIGGKSEWVSSFDELAEKSKCI